MQNADEVYPTTNYHARRPGHLVWPGCGLGGKANPAGQAGTACRAAPSAGAEGAAIGIAEQFGCRCADSRTRRGPGAEPMADHEEGEYPLEKAFEFKQQAVGRILKHAKLAGSWLTRRRFLRDRQGAATQAQRGISCGELADRRPGDFQQHHPDRLPGRRDFHGRESGRLTKLTRCLVSGLEVLSPPVSEGGMPNSVTSVSGKSYIVVAATPEQASRLAEAGSR